MEAQNLTTFVIGKMEGFHLETWQDQTTVLFGIFFLYFGYKLSFSPMNRIRTLTEVGWTHLLKAGLRNRTVSEAVKEAQKMRKLGQLPPVFPNGWFALLESRFLPKLETRSVSALGETFAVFRSDEGKVKILDAHCPHLGANMAVGGKVKGDQLECPFHGWVFDGNSGQCSSIPYASKVPECAKVKQWESCEVNGIIFVWYHVDDEPPSYNIPEVEEITDGSWKYRGRTEHDIAAHIQEIPENGADVAHLGHLHVPNILKGADLQTAFSNHWIYDLIQHHWGAQWSSNEGENSHIASIALTHSFSLFKGRYDVMGLKVSIEQIGPSLVHLFFDTPFGKGVLLQTVTPMQPLLQKVIHQFYTSSYFITPIAKMVMLAEANHVERDIMIWNSKQYLPQPMLVKEDKLISRFRKWYSKFYSENSPTLRSLQEKSLDW